MSFIFTVRGTPVVFQGTEQNKGNGNGQIMTGGIADTWNRWSMVKRDANGNVLENYFNENASTFKHVAKLNEIRKKTTRPSAPAPSAKCGPHRIYTPSPGGLIRARMSARRSSPHSVMHPADHRR
ncbi:hypothetical protein ACFTAO_12550 [Paenibacillus rhizoplanae]